ncbi:MAG: (2Fe-2S)-binding protein [Chitinophagaceae bacterium]|nr:MAG: (2Fe-2S)-binding protein [Chitinophagaceae bacterium]
MEKKYNWFKVAETMAELQLPANGLAEIHVNGKKICVAFANNALHACAAKCPHAGGPMAGGYMDALGNIVCPTHRYKFSLKNGRNTSGEGYFLKTYPVDERADGIFVGLEENNISNWLK